MYILPRRGQIQWGRSKTYESSFIHHVFVQFGKQHWRCKDSLPYIFCHSIVVKQAIVHFSYSSKPVKRLDYQILLKSPLTVLVGSAPGPGRMKVHTLSFESTHAKF